ncbi:MAG TPA: hypothetical protein VHZ07_07630 [Bryobacteraceae bacterium]|jgi:hypothetical protein|nr:hypothetical protein [Bryobacteraceae bacterium]
MHADCASIAQFDSAGTNVQRIFDLGGGGGAAVCENRLVAGRSALHGLLGMKRFPSDDTIRNLFLRFGMAQVQQFFEPLTEWMMERLPARAEGHGLDLDSTIFERHGEPQEGATKGYNPRRPGRLSHHPLLAVLAPFRKSSIFFVK